MNDPDLGGPFLAVAVDSVTTGGERERSVRRLERRCLTRRHDEIGSDGERGRFRPMPMTPGSNCNADRSNESVRGSTIEFGTSP